QIERVEQILGQRPAHLSELLHRLGHRAQHRVSVQPDLANRHRRPFSSPCLSCWRQPCTARYRPLVTDALAPPGPLSDTSQRAREHRSWYFYDWANSAFVTTTATVLFGPYLTAVAESAACGEAGTPQSPCHGDLSVLGLPIAAGSVAPYAVTFATLLSAVLLPLVGAIADRTSRKRHMLAGFAWIGAAAAACMFFVTGSNWALGVGLLVIATICLGSSLVVYDAVLV